MPELSLLFKSPRPYFPTAKRLDQAEGVGHKAGLPRISVAHFMPKIAVITMVQMQDLPWAYGSLSSIRDISFPGLLRLVLVNDACDEETERRLAAAGDAEIIVAGRNLGVAGGRNRLVREARARGADYVLSVDDDILLPTDFISLLWEAFQEKTTQGVKVGILTPATLDFHSVSTAQFTPEEIEQIVGGQAPPKRTTQQVRHALSAMSQFSATNIYHMGIRDWRQGYIFTNTPQDQKIQALFGVNAESLSGGPAGLKSAPGSLEAVLTGDDPIPVETAPGGICFYSTDLFDAVDGISEAFNPFGYEDADFALRAGKAGYVHFCAPKALAIHDIASRLSTRRLSVLMATQGKMAGAFARKHLEPREGAAAVYAISRRVFSGIAQTKRFADEEGAESITANRLSALAAFLGNAFLYLLSNRPWDEAPSIEKSLSFVEYLIRAMFPEGGQFAAENADGRLTLTAPGDNSPFLIARAAPDNDAVVVVIEKLKGAYPTKLAPALARVLASGASPIFSVKTNIRIGKEGAFDLQQFELETTGGLRLKLSGAGCRAAAPPNGVAPLMFKQMNFEMEDLGALARLLKFFSAREELSPIELHQRLNNLYSHDDNTPLFDWLSGNRRVLRGALDGVLDGAPQALKFNVSFRQSDSPCNPAVQNVLGVNSVSLSPSIIGERITLKAFSSKSRPRSALSADKAIIVARPASGAFS